MDFLPKSLYGAGYVSILMRSHIGRRRLPSDASGSFVRFIGKSITNTRGRAPFGARPRANMSITCKISNCASVQIIASP